MLYRLHTVRLIKKAVKLFCAQHYFGKKNIKLGS